MSEGVRGIAAPYLDDPGRRLLWTVPLALMVWIVLLMGFARVLEQSAPEAPEPEAIEARILELPPAGLQGGAAPAAAPIAKPAPVVHPHVVVHTHARSKPIVPQRPAEPSGTASPVAAAPAAASNAKSTGVAGGTGVGSGAGLGSDSGGARAIYAPVPKIPDDLREDAINTVAVAHFTVTYDGKVTVALVQPTLYPQLNQILIDTLNQWQFFPAMKNGVAISSEFDVRIPISVE
jgi:periplasmic protein TonB